MEKVTSTIRATRHQYNVKHGKRISVENTLYSTLFRICVLWLGYEFSKENGQDIVKELDYNSKWSKNRLDDSILDDFEYNKEVLEIKNGYYHYELVCRTSDENKKHNFTKEEATGWEIGVYDVDKNILYYYWQSI